jgi:ABC-type phosphate/phosphonate transport system permease subunit
MRNNLKSALQKAKYEPEAGLAEGVWRGLILKNKRTTKMRLWFFSVLGIASLLGAVPALSLLFSDFSKSGFYEYFSLAFSNGGILASYWKELILSLAQSIPTTSLALSLAFIFVFFLSIRFVLKQIINRDSIGRSYGIA